VSKTGPRGQQILKASLVYVAVIIGALGFSLVRARLAGKRALENEPAAYSTQPFFSLTTNRTFASNERAKLSVSYRSVDHLDFRQVLDPVGAEISRHDQFERIAAGAALLQRSACAKF